MIAAKAAAAQRPEAAAVRPQSSASSPRRAPALRKRRLQPGIFFCRSLLPATSAASAANLSGALQALERLRCGARDLVGNGCGLGVVA